jgi:hypothetical protein
MQKLIFIKAIIALKSFVRSTIALALSLMPVNQIIGGKQKPSKILDKINTI